MRKDDICLGGEKQEKDCPAATTFLCADCGVSFAPEDGDPDLVRRCVSCGSASITLQRCPTCPVLILDHQRSVTGAGRLLERVLDLDFYTQKFRVEFDDVSCEDVLGLKILGQERGRWERETNERREQEREMQQRTQDIQRRQKDAGGGF